jgi:alkanesulfonate monooxygenase SsuD/methylene tetrahydromethanopterin reductase-like flavin-dependent oxidoreductase (luciferase family)
LAILTGLWSTPEGEAFSYDGAFHSVTDSPGLPKPAQRPHPPIIVGGKGANRTPALTARYAAEFNLPFVGLEDSGKQIGRVRAACEAIDRDPDSLVYSNAHTICCGSDEAEVRRRAEFIGRTPDDLRAHALAGTPDEVIEQIARYAALGAQRVYLQVLDQHDLDHLDLLATEVMPHV